MDAEQGAREDDGDLLCAAERAGGGCPRGGGRGPLEEALLRKYGVLASHLLR